MAILIHKNTRVITQGISGRSGRFHTEQCLLYGSRFVGGVTPGRGGETILDLPVFDTVREAKKKQSVMQRSFLYQLPMQQMLF